MRERLEAVCAESEALTRRLADLQNQEVNLRVLLKEEDDRWTKSHFYSALTGPPNGHIVTKLTHVNRTRSMNRRRSPLAMMLVELLSDGWPWPVAKLAEAMKGRGFDFGDKSPRRVVHFALIGMRQSKIVDRQADGEWVMPEAVEQREIELAEQAGEEVVGPSDEDLNDRDL